MPDGRGQYCRDHDEKLTWLQRLLGAKPNPGRRCFCDEERDRLAGIHRASDYDDGFGGYLCICLGGRYSTKYGCMAPFENRGGRRDV